MRTRQEYAKIIRRMEILSTLFMTIGLILTLLFKWGYIGIIIIVAIFILFNAVSYNYMKRCRCENCGNIDIFEKKYGFTNNVKSHCPQCNAKIKNTIKKIEKN